MDVKHIWIKIAGLRIQEYELYLDTLSIYELNCCIEDCSNTLIDKTWEILFQDALDRKVLLRDRKINDIVG